MSPGAGSSSSRWSPTTEQLMILEELYRSGIRTPSASQIQQITTHLSLYGRIEGKNVFYWFQNHKARDRQKLRRKLNKQLQLQQQQQQQQLQLNNQDITNPFLASFDYPPGSTPKEFSFYNSPSPSFLFQGGAEHTSGGAINCKWNVYNAESLVEMKEIAFCNYGWTVVDHVNHQTSSACCTRPLKTLDLFPLTTTTTIKEDFTTRSPNGSSMFPCSSSKNKNSVAFDVNNMLHGN